MQPKFQKGTVGRPATGIGTPVQVRLQDSIRDAVDDWRREQPDIPGRPEAIRRLVELALSSVAVPIKVQRK